MMTSPTVDAIAIRQASELTSKAARTGSLQELQRALAHETAVLQRTYGTPHANAPIALAAQRVRVHDFQ